jgi:hypothetical protein
MQRLANCNRRERLGSRVLTRELEAAGPAPDRVDFWLKSGCRKLQIDALL